MKTIITLFVFAVLPLFTSEYGDNTVQLGYCDSDVTVCLLLWNMLIIQDRGVEHPYKRYRYYYNHFRLKAIVSQWLHRCTTAGVFVWKTRRHRFESWHVFFFFFFFFFLFFFLSVYVWKCDEGFVHFLHIVAKSPSAFPK